MQMIKEDNQEEVMRESAIRESANSAEYASIHMLHLGGQGKSEPCESMQVKSSQGTRTRAREQEIKSSLTSNTYIDRGGGIKSESNYNDAHNLKTFHDQTGMPHHQSPCENYDVQAPQTQHLSMTINTVKVPLIERIGHLNKQNVRRTPQED